jgi:hypothetical protein
VGRLVGWRPAKQIRSRNGTGGNGMRKIVVIALFIALYFIEKLFIGNLSSLYDDENGDV